MSITNGLLYILGLSIRGFGLRQLFLRFYLALFGDMQPWNLGLNINFRFANRNYFVDWNVINEILFCCDLVPLQISQLVFDPESKEPVLDFECPPVQVVHTVFVTPSKLLLQLKHSQNIVICARGSFEPLSTVFSNICKSMVNKIKLKI